MEEIIEGNYRASPFQELDNGEIDFFPTRLFGTVITMQYAASVNLTQSFSQNGEGRFGTLINSTSATAVPCPGGNRIAADQIDILIQNNVMVQGRIVFQPGYT